MDVWEYFEMRRREIAAAGLSDDDVDFLAEANSGDRRGRIWGRVGFSERTFLQVAERIDLDIAPDPRSEYASYLIIDGQEIWGKERDPSHDIAVHEHDRDHNSAPCDPITFKDALTLAWETASDEEFWQPTE